MAVLSTLVKSLAQVEGLEETQVAWVGRYLREANLLSQGGRGRGGARMSALDAAHLIVGVNAAASAKQAPEVVRAFKQLTEVEHVYPIHDDGDALSLALAKPRDAITCLADLVRLSAISEEAADTIRAYHLRVTFGRPIARLSVWLGWTSTDSEENDEPICVLRFSAIDNHSPIGDRTDETTVTEATFQAVAHSIQE